MKTAAESKNYISGLMALLALGIFAVCIMAVIFAGTEAYSGLTEQDQANYEVRTCTGFIATKVRQAPDGDKVTVEDFGGSDALVIEENIDGEDYKTLIYCHDGWLMEYFADDDAVDMENDAEFGSRLFPAESLDLTLEEGLLKVDAVVADGPVSMVLALRNGEEADYEK